MPKILSRSDLGRCVLSGMEIANRRFEIGSRGCWVSDMAVEGYMQSKIFDCLIDHVTEQGLALAVTMETPTKYMFNDPEIDRRTKPAKLLKMIERNEPDIYLHNEAYDQLYLGELKRLWGDHCHADLQRCNDFLAAHPDIRTTFFGVMLVDSPWRRKLKGLDAQQADFRAAVEASLHENVQVEYHFGDVHVPDMTVTWPAHTVDRHEEWQWRGAVAVFSRRKAESP